MRGFINEKIELHEVFSRYKSRPFIIGLIVLASVYMNFVVAFDANLYFFNSPFIVRAITAPDIYIGISASAFTLGVIIFAYVGGLLFNRYSIKYMLILSMVISTVFSVLTGYVSNELELVLFRFLFGVGNGLLQGLLTSLLGGLNPEKKGFLLSLKGLTFSAGMLLGPYTNSLYAPFFRITYLITGAIGIVCVLMLLFFLPDIHALDKKREAGRSGKFFNRNLSLTFISIFFFGIGLFGFLGYFSHYMMSFLGLDSVSAAVTSALQGLGGLIMTLPFGFITDKWSKKWIMVVIYAMLVGSTAAIFMTYSGLLILMVLSLIFGGAYNSLINAVSAASQHWAEKDDIGRASGATFSFYYGGGIIGGPMFGVLISVAGFQLAGIFTVTVFMFLGLLACLLITEKSHHDVPPAGMTG